MFLKIFLLTWCFKTKRLLPSLRRKDKKFIFLIWCIRKKFCLQKVGVVAGFRVSKNFNFWFRALLKNSYLLAPSLNEFFRQEGSPRIWMILVSHILLVLVSCPPFIPGVTLRLTFFEFWPAVSSIKSWHCNTFMQITQSRYWWSDSYIMWQTLHCIATLCYKYKLRVKSKDSKKSHGDPTNTMYVTLHTANKFKYF